MVSARQLSARGRPAAYANLIYSIPRKSARMIFNGLKPGNPSSNLTGSPTVEETERFFVTLGGEAQFRSAPRMAVLVIAGEVPFVTFFLRKLPGILPELNPTALLKGFIPATFISRNH